MSRLDVLQQHADDLKAGTKTRLEHGTVPNQIFHKVCGSAPGGYSIHVITSFENAFLKGELKDMLCLDLDLLNSEKHHSTRLGMNALGTF
jgi:hypothetical protein